MGRHAKARGDIGRHAGSRSSRGSTLRRNVIGAVAGAVLISFGAGWWSGLGSPTARATTPTVTTPGSTRSASSPTPVTKPVVPGRRATSVVRPEAPRSARLPSGTVVPIKPISTGADGVLAVPRDIRTAGWWRGGSRLGDPFGSTLIAAHVDSVSQGLGPYAQLLTVRPGQHIVLSSATLRQTFAVRSLKLVPQGTLADQKSIYAPTGGRRLTLVTCAPPFIRSRGGYQQLAIVTATPISQPLPKAG